MTRRCWLRLIGCIVFASLVVGCRSTAPPPLRLAPSLASLDRTAVGKRIELRNAVLFVPADYEVPADGVVPLFVHFQGGPTIAEENFVRMQRPGVLLASKLSGRSSAFAKPYRDPRAFRTLLDAAAARLARLADAPAIRFEHITITFFSAGYGAVRELLKEPEFFGKIQTLVAADSIYASVVAPDVRAPRAAQMVDFMRFAQAAAAGQKTFVVVHGMYQTPYASTAECADLLLASVGGTRQPTESYTKRGVPIASVAHVGGFHLYTFAEATAGFHMDCLYMIPEMVRRHARD